MALEYDDPTFRPEVWYPAFRNACIAHEVIPGVWFTQGGEIYKTPPDAAFAIAEIEGPGDYEGVINVINGVGGGPLPDCSLAVVTNFNAPLTSRMAAKPLIDAGFACLPEAYMNVQANMTPARMDQIARSLGWATSQPVAGVFPVNGQVPSYSEWADWPLAYYLLENLL